MSLSKRTIKKLWNEAGNECAHPDCNEKLIDFEEDTIIAEQCHIHARKQNGPRYDPEMDEGERESYENLLLLCRNHHQKVDGSPEKYTADVLRRWKENHEDASKEVPELSSEMLNRLLDEIKPPYILINMTERELVILEEFADWEPSYTYPDKKDSHGTFPVLVTLDEIKNILRSIAVLYQQKLNGIPLYKKSPEFEEDEIIAASSIVARVTATAMQHQEVEESRRKKEILDDL